MEKTFLCCICGKFTIGCGNSAAPIDTNGWCCDKCNKEVVIPKRLEELEKKKGKPVVY